MLNTLAILPPKILNRKYRLVCLIKLAKSRETINLILKNYEKIQKMIRKNIFYTKHNFKKELLNSIKNEFRK